MIGNHRIIIDTNLWISFLLTKQFDFLDELIHKKKITLVFSEELLTEFVVVCQRPKLRKYFSSKDVENLLNIIDEYALFVSVVSEVVLCRDAKDNFLLALAKDSRAHYLLTGDNDLLVLKEFENTKIITIAEYQSITNK